MPSKQPCKFERCLPALLATGISTLTISPAALAVSVDAGSTSWWAVLLPVMVVLGTLLAALIFVNRKRGTFNSSGPLRIVQVLSVGPRERIMVLSAGKDHIVVGVTTSQITLLSVLDPSAVAEEVIPTP